MYHFILTIHRKCDIFKKGAYLRNKKTIKYLPIKLKKKCEGFYEGKCKTALKNIKKTEKVGKRYCVHGEG